MEHVFADALHERIGGQVKYLIEIEVNGQLRGREIGTEIVSVLERLIKDIHSVHHAVDGQRLVNSAGITVGWARFSSLD